MIKFPFLNGQQLNLDWIMQQLRAILNFMPIDQGAVGDVLQRGTSGATWQPLTSVVYDIDGMSPAAEVEASDELPIYDVSAQGNYKVTVQDVLDLAAAAPVSSVNGQTGTVVLDAGDVGALPDTTTIPSDTADLTNTAGFVDAAGAAAAAPVQSVNGQTGAVVLGKSDVGLGSVDNVQQYSASNPPPYPVTSVNGQTGDVVITPGGSFSPTLLWTNSSPAASFVQQTIALDLSSYSFIVIEYATHYMTMRTALLKVPDITPPAGYSVHDQLSGQYVSGGDYKLCSRVVDVSLTGVVVYGGVRVDAFASSNTSDDEVCRPTRIWGI